MTEISRTTSPFCVVEEEPQPYVAVTGDVTMDTIPAIADRFDEVEGWLAAQEVEPGGPPFFRYRVIDMDRRLLAWAGGQGLVFDVEPSGEGEVWGCRLEWMETDPAVEPDMSRWQTRLAFRLAD